MNAAWYTKPNLSFPICETEATHYNLVWTGDNRGHPYAHLSKNEIESQSGTRGQPLWPVSPFLCGRDFPKVRAEDFKQRNPAVKILDCFSSCFSSGLGSLISGEKPLMSSPSPSLTAAAHGGGSFEKGQHLALILWGHQCSVSGHTLTN